MRLSALSLSGAGCGLSGGVYVQVQNQGVVSSRARRAHSSAAGLVWLLPRLTQRSVSRAAAAMLVRPPANGAARVHGPPLLLPSRIAACEPCRRRAALGLSCALAPRPAVRPSPLTV
jgi:hypothetical protein